MTKKKGLKLLNEIHSCPLCEAPVAEAPIGSGDMACIRWNCPYMTHYGWTMENYFINDEGEWDVNNF